MKKIIRYLQDQAAQASQQKYSGTAYLSPPTREPQQRKHVHGPSNDEDNRTARHQARAESENPSGAAHSFPAHTSAGTGLAGTPDGSAEASLAEMPRRFNGDITRHQYGQDNILQSYEVYIPELGTSEFSDPSAQRYWVVYIHGGYFRDSTVTSSSFYPALSQLVYSRHRPYRHHPHHPHLRHLFQQEEDSVMACIAGYASVNYRLSADDQEAPQDTNKLCRYELRNAQWPEQMYDVLAAIAHLQRKFGFGDRYLLVGHDVGATMAVLSTLAPNTGRAFSRRKPQHVSSGFGAREDLHLLPRIVTYIDPPRAVLGISGIYDFDLLRELVPSDVELTRTAMLDPDDTVLASPARYTAAEFLDTWTKRIELQDGQVRARNQGSDRGQSSDRRSSDKKVKKKKEEQPMKKSGDKPTRRARARALILAFSSNNDDDEPDGIGLADWKQVEAMKNVFRNRARSDPEGPTLTTNDGQDEVYVDEHEHEHENKVDERRGTKLDLDLNLIQDSLGEGEGEGEDVVNIKVIEMTTTISPRGGGTGSHRHRQQQQQQQQQHNIWAQGNELARLVREAVRVLISLDP